MTAAGVQNIDSAAYLPPPPSTSAPDAKGTGAAGKQATDAPAASTPGEPSDFQSELELQQTGKQPTDAGASSKPDSGKSGKKRNAQPDANPSAVTPVQVAEPQKQILPLALALAQPRELAQQQELARQQENAKLDDNAKPGEKAAPSSSVAAVAQLTELRQPAASGSQPVSLAGLKLSATPPEPVAAAVQGTAASATSSPSALAFAARLAAAPQKTVDPGAASPSEAPAVPDSQTPAQIPVRYAPTAQIIQSATLRNEPGTQQDGSKKDGGASSDGFARPDARTNMVLPQFETMSQSASSSGSAAPQQTAPPARPESVIEPPTAPPTSSHDIRVQVPDNNGGSTQVRFVESGGEVRVSVRTADEGLAQNLRAHLNDLTQRLSDGGMPAEIWKPAPTAASAQNDSHQPNQDSGGSGRQGSGGQGGQQDRQQKRPAWLDEMEASLESEQN